MLDLNIGSLQQFDAASKLDTIQQSNDIMDSFGPINQMDPTEEQQSAWILPQSAILFTGTNFLSQLPRMKNDPLVGKKDMTLEDYSGINHNNSPSSIDEIGQNGDDETELPVAGITGAAVIRLAELRRSGAQSSSRKRLLKAGSTLIDENLDGIQTANCDESTKAMMMEWDFIDDSTKMLYSAAMEEEQVKQATKRRQMDDFVQQQPHFTVRLSHYAQKRAIIRERGLFMDFL